MFGKNIAKVDVFWKKFIAGLPIYIYLGVLAEIER